MNSKLGISSFSKPEDVFLKEYIHLYERWIRSKAAMERRRSLYGNEQMARPQRRKTTTITDFSLHHKKALWFDNVWIEKGDNGGHICWEEKYSLY